MEPNHELRRGYRLQVCLPAFLRAAIVEYGSTRGLSLSASVRQLVSEAISKDASGAGSPLMLAALVAAEHAVLMVASVLPDGQRRMRELDAQASAAAEQRLALFREESE